MLNWFRKRRLNKLKSMRGGLVMATIVARYNDSQYPDQPFHRSKAAHFEEGLKDVEEKISRLERKIK